MDTHGTDAEIIARSIDDPDLFVEIFERHFASVYRFLVRRVGVDDGAELAQEVFVMALETRGRYDVRYVSARPWLFGIAKNLVHRNLRRRERGRRAFERLSRQSPVNTDPFPEVDDRVASQQVLAVVRALVAALALADRETLLLYAQGLSYRQVGSQLGIPEGTVRSRLHRARSQLRASMGDWEGLRG